MEPGWAACEYEWNPMALTARPAAAKEGVAGDALRSGQVTLALIARLQQGSPKLQGGGLAAPGAARKPREGRRPLQAPRAARRPTPAPLKGPGPPDSHIPPTTLCLAHPAGFTPAGVYDHIRRRCRPRRPQQRQRRRR
jgi:hypothetical protein